MLICAHRGAHAAVPENSLAAFEQAVASGCDGIETDIRVCSDGQTVLFHDRIAPDGRAVADMRRDELSDAAGYYVPTLNDVLDRWDSVLWILEIKQPDAVPAILDVLGRFARSRRLLVISFLHRVAAEVRQRIDVDCGVLVWHQPADDESFFDSVPRPVRGMETIVWNFEFADDARLLQAQDRGYRNFVFGPESAAEHQHCAQLGLTGVITDHPGLLLPTDFPASGRTGAAAQP